ncbi:streptococcal histidine triad protein [Streptococcus pneumoniae]|nr:streptococcal histidine triad protein [Streptococcus pneumoniae]
MAGKYTTEDGYIFDPRDITSDEGDAYVTPHMTHSHWIKKDSLSEAERAAAQAYAKEKGLTPPSTDHQDSGNTEAKGAEAIYNRVKAAKKVPLDRMPYNLQYTVEVKNGSLIIPHYDHYHNIKFEWFDEGLYEAPKGYTLEDLLATVKYYVEHPNERPHSDNGFGNASDHVQRNKNGQADTNQTDTMSNIQTNVRIQIMVLVTLATMFKETKMVKLIPIKRKNQTRRNLRQKNLRKKPLEKRNRKARNQSLQNQQRNQKKNHQKNHQRNQKNLRSRLKRLKKN